jgi:polar amino acid transport system substrate-binding protein
MRNAYLVAAALLIAALVWVVYGPLGRGPESDIIHVTPPRPESPFSDGDLIPLPNAPRLIFASDPWLPYAGYDNPAEGPEGYIVEVLRAIYEPLGCQVEYVNGPWTECLENVEDGTYSGLAGCDVHESPRLVYPELSIGVTEPTFYVLNSTSWRYDGIDSLESIRLGVIQDYTYETAVDIYVRQNLRTDRIFVSRGGDALTRLILALEDGRIHAFIENRPVVEAALVELGVESGTIIEAGQLPGLELFVPFSPKLSNARTYADIFDQRLAILREDGRLEDILAGYDMRDWVDGTESPQEGDR